jgi:hypothetical protein
VKIYKRIIKELINSAIPLYLHWPNAEAMALVKTGFENRHGILQICGAINCTYIRFNQPAHENAANWYDHYHNYYMILQCIMAHQSRFIDAFVEFLGSLYDARDFQQLNGHARIANGSHLNGPTREI